MSTTTNIPTKQTASKKYQSLYRFLGVLEGQQIHKLYKIVMGVLDPSAFTPDEIRDLEHRVSRQHLHAATT